MGQLAKLGLPEERPLQGWCTTNW